MVAQPRKVLLVDDDAMLRFVCERMLERAGFEVHVAENGPAALEVLRRTSVQTVLCDLNLPGQSGTEVMATIHGQWPEVRLVVFSGEGRDLPSQLEEARRHGASAVLMKPFVLDELLAAVTPAAGGAAGTDPG